ncbi:hypothetical protein AB3Z07_28315 (plasmid) [Metabacillus halosaccharovorans]|uniref:hypothetical protein n=1 Tax=Metabacillus halosaccharovorans TaxID=930124 RepID=UPI001C1FDB57|nr:hypothetical protein [Metabacillus halosaccharovorans]MBU7595850.1 hypothetical protein [Metabacillus halosaccharovorans]MCM3441425.1 hypothetical protein [Metabacillus halosaccharovorans]
MTNQELIIFDQAQKIKKVDYISGLTVSEMNGIHFVCEKVLECKGGNGKQSLLLILNRLKDFKCSDLEYNEAVRKKSMEFLSIINT